MKFRIKSPDGRPHKMTRKHRRYLFVALVILLMSLGGLFLFGNTPKTVISSSTSSQALIRTGIIVPLFSQNYSQNQVNEVIQAKTLHPGLPFIVIANFGNGPGSTYDSAKNEGIKAMQNAG